MLLAATATVDIEAHDTHKPNRTNFFIKLVIILSGNNNSHYIMKCLVGFFEFAIAQTPLKSNAYMIFMVL